MGNSWQEQVRGLPWGVEAEAMVDDLPDFPACGNDNTRESQLAIRGCLTFQQSVGGNSTNGRSQGL